METIWVIGAGKFGWHTVNSLLKKNNGQRFVLVDPVKENLTRDDRPDLVLEQADGIDFLNRNLWPETAPSWIIPALPVHLAAEWCLARKGTGQLTKIDIPKGVDLLVPNPMRLTDETLYASHADFRCPSYCSEPDALCTMTRKPRKPDLYALLEEVTFSPFTSIVIQSRQLAPGVGGYRPDTLLALLDTVEHLTGKFLLSTACRCHGVMSAFEKYPVP